MVVLFSNYQSKAQNKELNVYLANGDSIYYCEDSAFNIENLHRSKRSDTSFLKTIISIAKEKKYTVFFKPMTSFSNDAVAENIQNICVFFRNNNVTYKMLETGSIENKFFKDVSLLEYLRSEKQKKKEISSEIPEQHRPPAPPPVKLAGLEEDALITFVLSNDSIIHYYKGFFRYKYLTANFNEIGKIISAFKNIRKKRDNFIIYKKTKLATTKNVIDFINKIKSSGVASSHYGEFKLEYIEMKYLKDNW